MLGTRLSKSLGVALAASVARVAAQDAATPAADILANKHYTYPNLPYQVDTDATGRGPQFGYSECNSTTEGPNSDCQVFFTTSLEDFCLPGPPTANSTVADDEADMVAWCTKAGRGTRLIPDGALQGVQFIRTPGYVELVGYIDQTMINLTPDDEGGELDPHGADGRGNPLGGLMFSQAWNNGQWTQVTQWHSFLGGGIFCLKACIPGGQYDTLCDNVYDRIGCSANVPANYAAINGTFQSCLGDNQLPPGVYIQNGQQVTYQQPAGDIGTLPYTPEVPASSSCVATPSAQLYTDAASIAAAASSTSASIASVSSASVASVSSVSASISSVSYYSAHPIFTVTAAPTVVTQTQANAGTGKSKSSDARPFDASAGLSMLLAGGFAALFGVLTL